MGAKKTTGRLALKSLIPLGAVIVCLISSVIATYVQVKTVQREIRRLQQEKVVVMELEKLMWLFGMLYGYIYFEIAVQ